MRPSLSISTNPLINRFAEPEDLAAVCACEIGIRRLQLTNEFLNPAWPPEVVARLTGRFAAACARHGISVTSVCTGATARINNLGHPDAEVRAWTTAWLTRLVDIAADLGASSAGSQFAILTYRDHDDPARREAFIEAALDGWAWVWELAERRGLRFLFWEHMSIGREFGHTLASCADLTGRIARRKDLVLKPMLDVDHGDVASGNPDDTDPYAWLRQFGRDSPIIHLKQASANKGGHWPFVEPYNSNGRIQPAEFVAAVARDGHPETELCLELAFREREPNDRQAVAMLARSVDYWRPFVSDR